MFRNILIIIAMISIVGCSSHPVIRDVQYTDDDYVIAARTKEVEVQAQRTYPFNQERNAWVDVWYIRLSNNHTDTNWCASIEWRSMDYNINVPNAWFYLPAGEKLNIGSVVQKTWELERDVITIDDAAFKVFRLNLLEPTDGRCIVIQEKKYID